MESVGADEAAWVSLSWGLGPPTQPVGVGSSSAEDDSRCLASQGIWQGSPLAWCKDLVSNHTCRCMEPAARHYFRPWESILWGFWNIIISLSPPHNHVSESVGLFSSEAWLLNCWNDNISFCLALKKGALRPRTCWHGSGAEAASCRPLHTRAGCIRGWE